MAQTPTEKLDLSCEVAHEGLSLPYHCCSCYDKALAQEREIRSAERELERYKYAQDCVYSVLNMDAGKCSAELRDKAEEFLLLLIASRMPLSVSAPASTSHAFLTTQSLLEK
jgi:hypothetical protein